MSEQAYVSVHWSITELTGNCGTVLMSVSGRVCACECDQF